MGLLFYGSNRLFFRHRKNWFAARCEYLRLIKKLTVHIFVRCEFFLIYSQRDSFCDDWRLEGLRLVLKLCIMIKPVTSWPLV